MIVYKCVVLHSTGLLAYKGNVLLDNRGLITHTGVVLPSTALTVYQVFSTRLSAHLT